MASGLDPNFPNGRLSKALLKTSTINNFSGQFPSSFNPTRQSFYHSLDVFKGDSGMGLIIPSTVKLAAIQSTEEQSPILHNQARRWDSSTVAFFTTPY